MWNQPKENNAEARIRQIPYRFNPQVKIKFELDSEQMKCNLTRNRFMINVSSNNVAATSMSCNDNPGHIIRRGSFG